MADSLELVKTDVVKKQLQGLTVGGNIDIMALGTIFVQSCLFPDVKSVSAAVVKILAGQEMGISPYQAMQQLYIVPAKGDRPARIGCESKLIGALLRRSRRYDYRIKESTAEVARIEFFDMKESIGVYSFTMEKARKMKFVNNPKYAEMPEEMLVYKAISFGARLYCPDVISGVYDMDEVYSMSGSSEPPPSLTDRLKTRREQLDVPLPAVSPEVINVAPEDPERVAIIAEIRGLVADRPDAVADLSGGELEILDSLDTGGVAFSTDRLRGLCESLKA